MRKQLHITSNKKEGDEDYIVACGAKVEDRDMDGVLQFQVESEVEEEEPIVSRLHF